MASAAVKHDFGARNGRAGCREIGADQNKLLQAHLTSDLLFFFEFAIPELSLNLRLHCHCSAAFAAASTMIGRASIANSYCFQAGPPAP